MTQFRLPDFVKFGDGPVAVFMLHGGYGSSEYWLPTAKRFARDGYRAIAWDAPGYGISKLPDNVSIEGFAEMVVELIDLMGSEKNVLIGHSMGGIIAPKVVDLAPNAIDAVVISATLASLDQGGEEFERDFIEKRVPPLLKVDTLAEAAMPLLKTMIAPGSGGELVDLVLRVAGNTPSRTFVEAMMAIQRYKGNDVVRRLRKPALVIGGRHDPVALPNLVEELASMIDGAELKIFDDAGHYPFAECPDDYYDSVTDFLRRKVG